MPSFLPSLLIGVAYMLMLFSPVLLAARNKRKGPRNST
jgi:hypothetical protein